MHKFSDIPLTRTLGHVLYLPLAITTDQAKRLESSVEI